VAGVEQPGQVNRHTWLPEATPTTAPYPALLPLPAEWSMSAQTALLRQPEHPNQRNCSQQTYRHHNCSKNRMRRPPSKKD